MALYKLAVAPKIGRIEGMRGEIAGKEARFGSLLSDISSVPPPSEEEMGRWREAERELARRLTPYDRLALMRELVRLAHISGADRVLDVQAEDLPPLPGSPLNRYKLSLIFRSNGYYPIVSFFKRIHDLPPLIEVESVRLEGESPGISVEVILTVYEMEGGDAQE